MLARTGDAGLGAALVAVVIGAFAVSRATSVAPSAVTGAGTGLSLLLFATAAARAVRR